MSAATGRVFVFDADEVATRPPIQKLREFEIPREGLCALLETVLASRSLAFFHRKIEVGEGGSFEFIEIIERDEYGFRGSPEDYLHRENRWKLRVVGPIDLAKRVRQLLGCDTRCVDPARAVQLLGSDDPAEREWGEAGIEELAEIDREAVWQLTDHPDPEVAARAYRVLSRLKLLPEVAVRARAQRLLEELSMATGELRELLVDELLSLGKPATILLREELNNRELRPVPAPVVACDGKAAVLLSGYGQNCGSVGLWVANRPIATRVVGSISGIRDSTFLGPDDAWGQEFGGYAEFTVLREWLISASRIPPGATDVLWQNECAPADRTGSYSCFVMSHARVGTPITEICDGLTIEVPESRFESIPRGHLVVLREHSNPEFDAEIIEEESRVGLRVTNIAEDDDIPNVAMVNQAWFAAIGEDGAVLACGALDRKPVYPTFWNVGETRVMWLEAEIPGGAVELWLGYDIGAGDDQVVPAPLKLKVRHPLVNARTE